VPDFDAVVVGSGPNGLAAAVTLTAAGLRVLVIEGAPSPGGGCRTEELTLPGILHDVCSTAHPLAVASPFFRRFDLAARGVRFDYPAVQFAHPLDGGGAAVVSRSVADTAAGLGPDAGAYQRLPAARRACPASRRTGCAAQARSLAGSAPRRLVRCWRGPQRTPSGRCPRR
jgi:phytoene dehydrogenase-like protein